MSKHNRPEDLAATLGISIAVTLSDASALTAAGTDDGWIKVTPRGRTETRDGRSFTFDPEKLVARFAADGVDVPADTNHAIALRSLTGENAPAIGWAKEFEARPDGTYAKMDWLPTGRDVLAAKTHRYVSPTIHHDTAGNVTWLHSISLVPSPALTGMPALLSAGGDAATSILGAVAGALGLPAAADQAALLAAIGAIAKDAVPKTLYEGTVAALQAATSQLATMTSTARIREVEGTLEEALKARKILPYEREHYLALCATDAGFTTVKTLLASKLAMLAPSGLDGHQAPGTQGDDNPVEIAARASVYRDEQRRAGRAITTAEAVRHVQRNSA